MKNFILPVALLIIGLTLGYYLGKQNDPGNSTSRIEPLTEKDKISLGVVKMMVARYKKTYESDPSYTNSVWFPIDQMHDMTKLFKSEGADGIRIYLGQYSSEAIQIANRNMGPSEHAIPEKYKNRNSIVFVSTRNQNGAPRSDYFSSKFLGEPQNRGLLCPPDVCDSASLILKP